MADHKRRSSLRSHLFTGCVLFGILFVLLSLVTTTLASVSLTRDDSKGDGEVDPTVAMPNSSHPDDVGVGDWGFRSHRVVGGGTPALWGCEEIRKYVTIQARLDNGGVNVVYKATIMMNTTYEPSAKPRPVVVKKMLMNDTRLTPAERRTLFMNQLHFVKLQLRHPNLMRVYAICEGPNDEDLAMVGEYLPEPLHLPPPRDWPLLKRVAMLLGVADFLAFLAWRTPAHPGSPYFLCDVKIGQFMVGQSSNNPHYHVIKWADLDMVVPMVPSLQYPFQHDSHDPYDANQSQCAEPRLYARECSTIRPCKFIPCFGTSDLAMFKGHATEYTCAVKHNGSASCSSSSKSTCRGLGPKVSSFWFGEFFLRNYFNPAQHPWLPPRLIDLMRRCLSLDEAVRPHPFELVRILHLIKHDVFLNRTKS